MASEIMTLQEVAEILRMNEDDVTRLAQEGQLMAKKVSRQWQFDRSTVMDWREQHPPKSVAQQQLPAEATGLPEPLTVANALTRGGVNLNLKAADKNEVLRELVSLVIVPREKRLFETLLQALKAREDLCPTCVSEGFAIPHSRNALVGVVDKPVIAYGRHPAGLDFGAFDGKPIQHFFLLCAPNVRQHLQLLAGLARLVNDGGFRGKLRAVDKPEQVIALIRDAEENLPG